MTKKLFVPLIAGLLGVCSLPALAATQTWQIASGGGFASGGSSAGNTVEVTEGGITMTVSAWSDTDGVDTSGVNVNETVETAELVYYGASLGIRNNDETYDSPNHSIDSFDDTGGDNASDFDAALLDFGTEEIILEQIGLGWAREDTSGSQATRSDVSILRYTSATPFSGNFTGMKWADLIAPGGGWSLVGNYTNLAQNTYHSINAGGAKSNLWLASVINPDFGSVDGYRDGFKFAGAVGSSTPRIPNNGQVPSPGSLALMMAGGLLLLRTRRSANKAGGTLTA